MNKPLITAVLLAGLAPVALAANQHTYAAIQGTFVDADNLRNSKEGYGGTLVLGQPITEHIAAELNLFGLRMDNTTNSFNKQLGGGIDVALYPFTRQAPFAPFLLVGSGAQYEDRNPVVDPQRGYTFINMGGGFLIDLLQNGALSLRAEAKRYRVHDKELVPGRNQLWDTRISAGLQAAFGGGARQPVERVPVFPVAPPPPAEPPPPVYLPAEPALPVEPLPPPPMDSDEDGVIDEMDRCPGTLPGLRVDEAGCPLPLAAPRHAVDSDADGILDVNDACPDTPNGMRVDSRGCAIRTAKVVLRDINFEYNSARLTGTAQYSLDRIVEGLRGQPSMALLIEGHTDSIGSDAYNAALSQSRAEAAQAYLIQSGIDPMRLQARGLGESQPLTTNDTESGRAENRRVEFKVIQQ